MCSQKNFKTKNFIFSPKMVKMHGGGVIPSSEIKNFMEIIDFASSRLYSN